METVLRAIRWGAVAVLALLVYTVATLEPGSRQLWAVMWQQALAGHIGTGNWNGVPNQLDLSQAQPGDIILGRNPGTTWGHWTTAAFYIGDGQVVDSWLMAGTVLAPLEKYRYYTEAAILRLDLPPEVKAAAVRHALTALGKPFYLAAPRRHDNWFYCMKIPWWAYYKAGVDIDPGGGFWVVPDRFLNHPQVTVIGPG